MFLALPPSLVGAIIIFQDQKCIGRKAIILRDSSVILGPNVTPIMVDKCNIQTLTFGSLVARGSLNVAVSISTLPLLYLVSFGYFSIDTK